MNSEQETINDEVSDVFGVMGIVALSAIGVGLVHYSDFQSDWGVLKFSFGAFSLTLAFVLLLAFVVEFIEEYR